MISDKFNTIVEGRQILSSADDLVKAVLEERPDLRGQEIVKLKQGGKAFAIRIGNEVFKAPYKDGPEDDHPLNDFSTECQELKNLKEKEFSTQVPHLTIVGKKYLYLGMTVIEGVPLPHNFESQMQPQQRQKLAHDLVTFIIEMSRNHPVQGEKFAIHDDLWHSNIIVDPNTLELRGVIDFGKVAYVTADEWKPMYDFDGTPFRTLLQEEFDRRRSDLPGSQPAQPQARRLLKTLNAVMHLREIFIRHANGTGSGAVSPTKSLSGPQA